VPAPSTADRTPRTEDAARRGTDVLTMHRLACRGDGGAALLDWLGRRAGGWAGLVDPAGAVLLPTGPAPVEAPVLADAVARMRERGLAAFAAESGQERIALLAVEAGAAEENPVLAVVGGGDGSLLADAIVPLATAWSAHRARHAVTKAELADARCREAVLLLLMGGHLTTARQLAATLSPPLPERLRVHVIEVGPARRDEVAARCTQLTDGRAFVVRCPVYSQHVIVLAPGGGRPLDEMIARDVGGCAIGVGDEVALRDAPVGYEQAIHALAVARRDARRRSRFDATLGLAAVVAPQGFTWADAVLAPLLEHVPVRSGDPDATELVATARSWLSFTTAAHRHLGVHRNTIGLRLKRIEELLGVDLTRPEHQASLDLALRIRALPRPADPPVGGEPRPDLDDLLRLPAARSWAEAALRPVRSSPHAERLEPTLRAWLHHGGRLRETGEALGLSVAGVRKRIERLEQVLARSVLHSPSARHDLWLAVRAADLAS